MNIDIVVTQEGPEQFTAAVRVGDRQGGVCVILHDKDGVPYPANRALAMFVRELNFWLHRESAPSE